MPTQARELLSRLLAAFRSRAGVHLILPALVAASFVMLFALDPFGVGGASHARSEQATLRVVSPWYRPSGEVTAIVIDDDYIRKRNAGWPLRYGEQGRLMRSLLAAHPAVLMIDLVYPHRHATSSDTQAVDEVQQLLGAMGNSGETRIVFTAMALDPEQLPQDFRFCEDRWDARPHELFDPDSMQRELYSELQKLQVNQKDSRFRLAYVRWSGCGNRYPLLLGGNSGTVTPAFATFEAYCDFHNDVAGEPPGSPAAEDSRARCRKSPPALHAQDYLHPMIVRSGAFAPAAQAFAYGPDACQPFADGQGNVPLWRQLWTTIEQLTLGLFSDLREDRAPSLSLPCPAVTVVPLSMLEKATADELSELLAGKAVLVGANLTGIPDTVVSPVHGQIPGVVWHAMALDNLLSLGPGYLAERHETLQNVLAIVLVALFAYLFPYIVEMLEHSRMKATLSATSFITWCALALINLCAGRLEAASLALGIGVALDLTKPTASAGYLFAILVAALGSVLFLSQGWPPGNWFGLVIVIIGFVHTLRPYLKGEDRKRFPHGCSLLGSWYERVRS